MQIKGSIIFSSCLLLVFTLTHALSSGINKQNQFVTVAIVGTNDIHGTALPTSLYRPDNNQTYEYGGLQYMASMIETIREEHPGNFLYLDAGDQFQGGIESSPLVSSGEIMNDFYNSIGVDSSAIGNHEFDFGRKFLFDYFQNRLKNSWNLAANVISEKGQEQFLPRQKNSWLFTLESGIKVGVIGLTTTQTPRTTKGFKKHLFPKYKFLPYPSIVIRESKRLRLKGAHAIVLLAHVGNYCNANATYGIWEENTIQRSTCKHDEITRLLDRIPTGTVDAILQGHRHRFSHHFIRGVPVMGTINGGNYFNILYLRFYNKQIYDKVIEGPVPVCPKVFSNNRKCDYQSRRQLKRAGQLVEWSFHGKKVVAHPGVEKLYREKWQPKMKVYFEKLALNEIVLQKEYDKESLLGNLITDLIDMAFPDNDFVLINEGGFRTVWFPGVLQYQHFYNMFPFTNRLVSFEMTGHELVETLKVLQSGRKSFYPTKKLRQHVRILPNGTRQLTKVTFSDGSEIELGRNYRGISIDFLLNGGDDFAKVVGSIYTLRKEVWLGEFRESLKPQLMRIGSISEQKLIDEANPRLILQ